jgi:hypothetical protein
MIGLSQVPSCLFLIDARFARNGSWRVNLLNWAIAAPERCILSDQGDESWMKASNTGKPFNHGVLAALRI